MTANPVQDDQSNHTTVDYHFVWERVAHEHLIVRNIPIGTQIVDISSKHLASLQFLCSKCYSCNPQSACRAVI